MRYPLKFTRRPPFSGLPCSSFSTAAGIRSHETTKGEREIPPPFTGTPSPAVPAREDILIMYASRDYGHRILQGDGVIFTVMHPFLSYSTHASTAQQPFSKPTHTQYTQLFLSLLI